MSADNTVICAKVLNSFLVKKKICYCTFRKNLVWKVGFYFVAVALVFNKSQRTL